PGTRVRRRRPEHMPICRAPTSGVLEAGTSIAKARLALLPGHDDIVRFLARNYRLSWSLVLAAVAAEIFRRRGNILHSRTISELMVPMTSRSLFRTVAVGAVLMMPTASALAASCGTGSFDAWLTDFKNEAAAKGISQSAIASGLTGVMLDQAVLSRDRSQRVFGQSFEEVSGRMAPPRLARGANLMKQYGSVLARIEQSYGVPGEVLV